MNLHEIFVAPFLEYSFMARALTGCLALSFGAAPVGVFLVLRRMSLIGDTMAHAILPGAAAGALVSGYSLAAMSLGGFVAGIAVALGAGLVARLTRQREDASFAAFYLLSLAAGALLIAKGGGVDLFHMLFGSVLAVDDAGLILVTAISNLTLIGLALIWRPLVMESCDPLFLAVAGSQGATAHLMFLLLVVLNLVAGAQVLGTLMAVGLMMLPAACARLWSRTLGTTIIYSFFMSVICAWLGLVLSFHFDLPSGPSIILFAGGFYILSIFIGSENGMRDKPHASLLMSIGKEKVKGK